MKRADVVSAEGDDVFGWLGGVGWMFSVGEGSDVFVRLVAHVAFRGILGFGRERLMLRLTVCTCAVGRTLVGYYSTIVRAFALFCVCACVSLARSDPLWAVYGSLVDFFRGAGGGRVEQSSRWFSAPFPSFAALLEAVGIVGREILSVKVGVLALGLDHPVRHDRAVRCGAVPRRFVLYHYCRSSA